MAKAFGKIILAGEHSVVYGYPAIAQTIGREVSISVRQDVEPGLHCVNPLVDPLQVLSKLKELLGERVGSLGFEIKSDVPEGCGLGSSAALSVALIRTILEYYAEVRSKTEIAGMALELEKIFHGNPSGVDHTVIAQEGLIWFQKGVSESILAAKPMKLVVAISKPHAGTLKAVQAVRKRYEERPSEIGAIFESIGDLTHQMRTAIELGDLVLVGALMNQNQSLLKSLGVSTQELDQLCTLALEHGALGAKLTGAGGGGCVIALTEQPARLLEIFEEAGYRAFLAVA